MGPVRWSGEQASCIMTSHCALLMDSPFIPTNIRNHSLLKHIYSAGCTLRSSVLGCCSRLWGTFPAFNIKAHCWTVHALGATSPSSQTNQEALQDQGTVCMSKLADLRLSCKGHFLQPPYVFMSGISSSSSWLQLVTSWLHLVTGYVAVLLSSC